jgi:hypothetical protein
VNEGASADGKELICAGQANAVIDRLERPTEN